jgi:hypothetical protein
MYVYINLRIFNIKLFFHYDMILFISIFGQQLKKIITMPFPLNDLFEIIKLSKIFNNLDL